jgi:hypothetical protein
MRQIGGCLLVLAIVFVSAALSATTYQEKTPDYFPLTAGTKWFYTFDHGGKKTKFNRQIGKLETVDGKSLALLETVVGGNVTNTEHLTTTDKGVYRYRVDGTELSPPVCVLKYPLKKNETWETESIIANEQVKVKGKVIDAEEVTVPAGTYKTFRVEVETSVAGMQATLTFWVAPDVGIVKQTIDGSGKDFVELTSFEAGK